MSGSRIRQREAHAGRRGIAIAMAVVAAVLAALIAPGPARAANSAEPTIAPARPGSLLFLGNRNLAPVVHLDGTAATGLAVDLVRAIEPELSKPVEVRAMDWKQAQALVASGHADALVQINSTPERQQLYDFSEPFLESHFSAFVRSDRTGISDLRSLRGLRVGVEAGGLPQQVLGRDPQINLTTIPNFSEGFRRLNTGTLDAVVVDYRVGAYVLATEHFEGIKAVGDPIAPSYSSIAVRKGNAALLSEINEGLRTIKRNGTYQKILDSWAPTIGVFETQAQINERMYRTASLVLLGLLVLAAIWSVTIGIQMRKTRAAEAALRESERTYRALVAGMAEGVIVRDAHGRTSAVNAAAEQITGRSAAELLGRTAEEIDFRTVGEDGAPLVGDVSPSSVTLRTGIPQTDSVIGIHRPDGTLVWLSYNAIPLMSAGETKPHAVVTTFRDITEHRRADEALRASQRKLALHLEQTLLGVVEWDAEGRAREWNPAAEAIFGYSRAEAIGRLAADLVVLEEGQAEFESLLRGQDGQFRTMENVTREGRDILCEWVSTPLTGEDGEYVGAMSLVRDVTEQRQAEELKVAKEAAEAANVARSAFLANMSHEIRTPMNAILGFTQILRHDRGLSEQQKQQLDVVTSSGERLLALVNDVIEMSKVESGRITANPSAFDLRALINEVSSLFGLRTQAKGLTLRVDCAQDVPQFVVADANKLRQVLVNLLGNAVKFTRTGGVELRVGVRRERGDAMLRLLVEVEDTGPGFTPEETIRWSRYFAETVVGVGEQPGPGLGLTISREFVRVLGGVIGVESEPGRGSVFKVDIPIELARPGEVSAVGALRRVVGLRPDGPVPRVLIADDASDNRELLIQILKPVGFEVRAVSNGEEALAAFEEWRPRLILMDMRMPIMDGYQATRRIRSLAGGGDVSIMAVTASALGEMQRGVFDAGVDEFLVKPFREAELFDKIAKLLGVRYVYEERAEGSARNGSEALDHAAVAALSEEVRARITRATEEADFDAVLKLADEIARTDERTGAALRALAERFDGETILGVLGGDEE